MLKLIVGTWLLLFCASSSYADVYKWIDENGQTRFSDKAPTQNKFEKLNIPTTSNESHIPQITDQERLEKQKKLLQVFEQDRQEKRAKIESQQAQKRKKWNDVCSKQNAIMSTIRTGTISKKDSNGNREVLPESERANIEQQVKNSFNTNCN